MGESERGSGLPPAHSDFAAHFTRAAYHPAHPDFEDEVPPFGSDEGWDEVHTWSERVEELLANPTLRYMVEDGRAGTADALIAELARTEQPDVDAALIGMGFALLRCTGQIDTEGRLWLHDALNRVRERGTETEYDMLIDDLESFKPERSTLRTNRASVGAPAHWISISGADLPELTRWLRAVARSLNSDPTWTRWWSIIPFARLGLYVVPLLPQGNRSVHIDFDAVRNPQHLQVLGAERALGESLLEVPESDEHAFTDWSASESTHALCAALIRQMLQATSVYTGVRAPDGYPPPL